MYPNCESVHNLCFENGISMRNVWESVIGGLLPLRHTTVTLAATLTSERSTRWGYS